MLEGRGSLMNLLHLRTPFALAEDQKNAAVTTESSKELEIRRYCTGTLQQACHG
jgi:hypothetical protein